MFITFEGIEGSGKTTQIGRLVKNLERHGIPLIKTFEPGGTRIGKNIRRILLDSRNWNLSPMTELLLYIADRAQHVEEVIRPALEKGKWVICDRYFDATVVYQGEARGQDMRLIRDLNETSTGGIQPDITFLLDSPVEMGLRRARRREKTFAHERQDRFERERVEFHHKVREGYLMQAHLNPQRFIVIDAAQTKDEVEERIFQHIRPHLNELGPSSIS